jgi:hypothetical protein
MRNLLENVTNEANDHAQKRGKRANEANDWRT